MKYSLIASTLLISTLSVFNATASVTVGGTRVIYEGTKKETSISVENKDKVANLVQSWITPVDATTPGKNAMIITPPLFREEVGAKNVLRIVRSGLPMPEDKESMYWLNIKGIPSAAESQQKNTVEIAINTRIKLIYRPKSLCGTVPDKVTDKLSWAVSGNQIKVTNPTPYYMNFSLVKINGKTVDKASYVAPLSSATFAAPAGAGHGNISWRILNDFGMASKEHNAQI
jgi:fimbrial chaperone protein